MIAKQIIETKPSVNAGNHTTITVKTVIGDMEPSSGIQYDMVPDVLVDEFLHELKESFRDNIKTLTDNTLKGFRS